MDVIEVQHTSKRYEMKAGTVAALDDISFSVAEGEFVGIVGKSGSGKSTIINMLAGIDRPSEGSIRIFDKHLETMNENQLAALRGQDIGIVFQFFQLLPVMSVLENILLPMDFLNKFPLKERTDRAYEVLRMVDMQDYAMKLPGELSGGLQQKAAIARALANNPPIIVADEPTGNLDSVTAAKVFELFETLAANEKTIVMVTHDAELVHQASRIITIRDGKIVNEECRSTRNEGVA